MDTIIQLQGINKTYNNGSPLHVLKGIDLEIHRGEMVSIKGASGSGKSTLLNILGILDNYDTGTYYLNGQLIKNPTETQAAEYRNRMIGFIFQSFNLINYKNAQENELYLFIIKESPAANEMRSHSNTSTHSDCATGLLTCPTNSPEDRNNGSLSPEP